MANVFLQRFGIFKIHATFFNVFKTFLKDFSWTFLHLCCFRRRAQRPLYLRGRWASMTTCHWPMCWLTRSPSSSWSSMIWNATSGHSTPLSKLRHHPRRHQWRHHRHRRRYPRHHNVCTLAVCVTVKFYAHTKRRNWTELTRFSSWRTDQWTRRTNP